MKPFPVILSAPSGGGKTSIARKLLQKRSDMGYSISCTTRPPRAGEVDGRDYHFWNKDRFDRAIGAGEFAEWAMVHGKQYGTLRREIEGVLTSGRHVVLDVDVQGAEAIGQVFPESVLIFILPPSAEALATRLGGRRTESAEEIRVRVESARRELSHVTKYDYVIINEDLDSAVSAVESIVQAESLRGFRFRDLESYVSNLVSGLEKQLREAAK